MRYLWTSALKDTKRRLADPAALAVWIGLPLFVGTLLSVISSGGGGVPKAHVLLVDQDDTPASRLVVTASTSGRMADYLIVERVTEADGRRKMDAGEASAMLVLPKGFQRAILDEQPAELVLTTNPSQRILPQIVEEGLDMLVEAVFYAQQILGEPLRRIAQGPEGGGSVFSSETIASLSVDINNRVARLQNVVFPPVIGLRTPSPEARTPQTIGVMATVMTPTMLFMSLLFIAQGSARDIWQEKIQGTLRRSLAVPSHIGWFLAGKVLAGAALAAVVTLVGLVIVRFLGVPLLRLPGAFVWCTFNGAALLCLFNFFDTLAATETGARMLSTIIVFPMMFMGGSFFPFEAMPPWMQAIGRWTPNGLGGQQLKALLRGAPDYGELAVATLVIIGLSAVTFLITVRRVRGAFATS
ncbi:MAG: ABC-2 transporter permease [Acidobacteria bacterium]|nr:ABC-2 transporter permease [Acidobacteriota bacterium]MBI3264836.1 ABC-2 transporter permease [Acidobacteriota bacterium]